MSAAGSEATSQGLDPDEEMDLCQSKPFTCPSTEYILTSHKLRSLSRGPTFRFCVRQHPTAGAATGQNNNVLKTSRVNPLDPPPICELIPESEWDSQFLSAPELSVRASLVHPDSPYEQVRCHERNSYPIVSGQQQTAFISPVTLERDECYFIFADLSVRDPGRFRLRFDLLDRCGTKFQHLLAVYSHPFTVVNKKQFPGLQPSTELIRAIARRGLRIKVVNPSTQPSNKRLRKIETDAPMHTLTAQREESPQRGAHPDERIARMLLPVPFPPDFPDYGVSSREEDINRSTHHPITPNEQDQFMRLSSAQPLFHAQQERQNIVSKHHAESYGRTHLPEMDVNAKRTSLSDPWPMRKDPTQFHDRSYDGSWLVGARLPRRVLNALHHFKEREDPPRTQSPLFRDPVLPPWSTADGIMSLPPISPQTPHHLYHSHNNDPSKYSFNFNTYRDERKASSSSTTSYAIPDYHQSHNVRWISKQSPTLDTSR